MVNVNEELECNAPSGFDERGSSGAKSRTAGRGAHESTKLSCIAKDEGIISTRNNCPDP